VFELRPQESDDLPRQIGGDSLLDDFGPTAARTGPAPCVMDADGALTVVTGLPVDGRDGGIPGDVAGVVSWRWQRRRWGPNEGSACVQIGIWLRPEHRGRGLGSAAQALLVDMLFAHTLTHRVEAYTDVANLTEQRALEKAGLSREGVIRGSQWRVGAHHDGVLYAVLRNDPRPSSVQPAPAAS
jgi:GNAT superfamily N-acetyltransferase